MLEKVFANLETEKLKAIELIKSSQSYPPLIEARIAHVTINFTAAKGYLQKFEERKMPVNEDFSRNDDLYRKSEAYRAFYKNFIHHVRAMRDSPRFTSP